VSSYSLKYVVIIYVEEYDANNHSSNSKFFVLMYQLQTKCHHSHGEVLTIIKKHTEFRSSSINIHQRTHNLGVREMIQKDKLLLATGRGRNLLLLMSIMMMMMIVMIGVITTVKEHCHKRK